MDPKFSRFHAWPAVLAWVNRGGRLWYWAPMDMSPVRVRVVKKFKNGKLRLTSDSVFQFTADAGHLDRMRRLNRDEVSQ